jgi:hypothetical protein
VRFAAGIRLFYVVTKNMNLWVLAIIGLLRCTKYVYAGINCLFAVDIPAYESVSWRNQHISGVAIFN